MLVAEISRAVRELRLPGCHVLVAVSGGIDSTALVHALRDLVEGEALKLSIGHVNHGLRGAESEADEAAVRALGTALGSLAVSEFRTIPRGAIVTSQWALVTYLFILYHEIENAPYWAHALRSVFRDVEEAFFPFGVASFACAFFVFAIPIGLAGALLPFLFHHLRGKTEELG